MRGGRMWGLEGEAFGGQPAAGSDAARLERLAALRQQRMLLSRLSDDIETSARLVGPTRERAGWRSAAERSYASRREELAEELRRARIQVADALDGVARAIAAVKENP